MWHWLFLLLPHWHWVLLLGTIDLVLLELELELELEPPSYTYLVYLLPSKPELLLSPHLQIPSPTLRPSGMFPSDDEVVKMPLPSSPIIEPPMTKRPQCGPINFF